MSSPTTPQSQTLQAAVSTPSPGSWRHPRSDEIARRQKANTFDESNLRKVVWNGGALAALFYASSQYVYSPTYENWRVRELTGEIQSLGSRILALLTTSHHSPALPHLPARSLQYHNSLTPSHQEPGRNHRHSPDAYTAIASRPRPKRYTAANARNTIHHPTPLPPLAHTPKYIPRSQE